MADFSKYMDVPIGQMVRVTLPEGHYFGRIKSYEPKESTEKKKPMLNVQFTLDSAGSDVPADQLPAQGVSGKTVSVNYMMDMDFGQDAIRLLILAAGVTVDPAQGWGQYLPQIANQPVMLHIRHRPRDKNDPNSDQMEDIDKVLPPS